MKLRLSEMKPDYHEPKESAKESDGLKGQQEQQKWGAIYQVPPWQAVPVSQPLDKHSSWAVQNSPITW